MCAWHSKGLVPLYRDSVHLHFSPLAWDCHHLSNMVNFKTDELVIKQCGAQSERLDMIQPTHDTALAGTRRSKHSKRPSPHDTIVR
jgi:hypothetical protein